MRYFDTYTSPFGEIVMRSDGEYLKELYFGVWDSNVSDSKTQDSSALDAKSQDSGAPIPAQCENLGVFTQTKQWLNVYFAGEIPRFTPPLLVEGSAFMREVCEVCAQIPYGKVASYGAIAREIATKRGIPKMSAQAVGGALGRNPIALIIPCHRVIGAGNRLGGYGFGVVLKSRLLALEGNDMRKFRA